MLILRRFYSRRAMKIDPGIAGQRKLFPDISETEMEDLDFENLESDFTNVHKSHRDHEKDLQLRREREKFLIVGQKYFKDKWCNFLTWQDKEQIRYLHQNDPEEWTIEKLSEGFPALPEVIKRIVKGKWSKTTQQKIINHDQRVQENWAKFKQNNFHNLPADLREHLAKFTHRQTQTAITSAVSLAKHRTKPKEGGDFSEIILSYQRLKDKKKEAVQDSQLYLGDAVEVPVEFSAKPTQSKFNKIHVTLKEFRENEGVKLPEKVVEVDSSLTQEELSKIVQKRHNQKSLVQKRAKDMSHLIYPGKITIPPDIHQEGFTYKLNDCYYNSDGYFLYRVPGMV